MSYTIPDGYVLCDYCQGNGSPWPEFPVLCSGSPCPTCNGYCPRCDGEGVIRAESVGEA